MIIQFKSLSLFVLLVLIACGQNTPVEDVKNEAPAEKKVQVEQPKEKKQDSPIEILKYEDFFEKVKKNDGKLYLANFWATWCKPCIEELPDFVATNDHYKTDPNFKMYLVSMDNAKNIDDKVMPFLENNKITIESLLMDDNKRMDTWISLVNEDWSGAIPATVLYKDGEQVHFTEGKMTEEELKTIIDKNL